MFSRGQTGCQMLPKCLTHVYYGLQEARPWRGSGSGPSRERRALLLLWQQARAVRLSRPRARRAALAALPPSTLRPSGSRASSGQQPRLTPGPAAGSPRCPVRRGGSPGRHRPAARSAPPPIPRRGAPRRAEGGGRRRERRCGGSGSSGE